MPGLQTAAKAAKDIRRSILVTGGAGFIASWVVNHLVRNYPEYRVICYDKLGYCSSTKNISMLDGLSNFKFVKGDITKIAEVTETFKKFNVNTVIHLAAESHVDHSFGDPFQFTNTNVLGTQVILEVSKTFGVSRFVHMSTDEVYGEVGKSDKDLLESSILVPTNPYAASKASSDMLVSAYLKSFNLPALVVRCNNIYGPRQYPEKIIPKFILLLARGQKCVLHGDGLNKRRYLHVTDAVNAIDTVFHKGEVGCIYNAGSDTEISNLDLCKKLLRIFNHDPSNPKVLQNYVEFTRDRPFNDSRYAIDSTRIKRLGWEPKIDFDKGLKDTVDWYLENGNTWWDEDISKVLVPFPAKR